MSMLELSRICTILLERWWRVVGPMRAAVVGMLVEVDAPFAMVIRERCAAEDPCRSCHPTSRAEPAHITAKVVNISIANIKLLKL